MGKDGYVYCFSHHHCQVDPAVTHNLTCCFAVSLPSLIFELLNEINNNCALTRYYTLKCALSG